MIDERQLFEQAQKGDKTAFGRLMDLHKDKVINTVYKLSNNYEATQDNANSLFCSSLWLLNISSQIKHIYLTAIFILTNEYVKIIKISPKEFQNVGDRVYSLVTPVGMTNTFIEGIISDLRDKHIQTDASIF